MMSTIDNIAAKLTKVEIQYLINNPDKLANIWNDLQIPKKQLECEVGDCFIETDSSDGWINLYKITIVGSTNVEFEEIDIHTVSGDINLVDDYISKEIAYEHFKPISTELYDKVHKICDDLDTQINYMYKGAVVMIKELCQSLNQNQEKK